MLHKVITGKLAVGILDAGDRTNTASKSPMQKPPSPEQVIADFSRALGLPPRQ